MDKAGAKISFKKQGFNDPIRDVDIDENVYLNRKTLTHFRDEWRETEVMIKVKIRPSDQCMVSNMTGTESDILAKNVSLSIYIHIYTYMYVSHTFFQTIIDYLKIDIDGDTLLDSFQTMLYNKALKTVKQLAFSIRTNASTPKHQLVQYHNTLRELEGMGFRRWMGTRIPENKGKQVTGHGEQIHQVTLINVDFKQ